MTATPVVTDPAMISPTIVRIEVHPRPGEADPVAEQVLAQLRADHFPVRQVRSTRVFLVQAPLDESSASRIAHELLVDPVNQTVNLGASPVANHACCLEVHYQPGVMDPVAQSTRNAIVEMLPELTVQQVEVRTGYRYDLLMQDADAVHTHREKIKLFALRQLANPVIQDLHLQPFVPIRFPQGSAYQMQLRHIPMRDLDDQALAKMSREAHLFLSLDEMRAVRDYFRRLDREPTDIELETLAQTWSEHCVHKTLKSTITYRETDTDGFKLPFTGRPGHTIHPDGSVTIDNLLKRTVAAATHELMQTDDIGSWCVSVFKDNAGIVKFDDRDAVCIKVETHNHPSAIEPYGGAATGIGGCIRDVMGTGLAARPIANTDVFCVAPPDAMIEIPKGVIPPQRILQQVVGGVRDYGNRMGIPTVNGAVYFHPDYLGNPLVYCGCVGLIPLDKCFGKTQPGDHIIALGGATGRDGIHGATFSSAELTDTHADEFSHAVQIGNAITQKKTLDVILQARDPIHPDGSMGKPLFNAITDCGAGGFSSAVGEMGKDLGAVVHLDRAPLKYQGLSYTEIWISEAQERMVLAVPPENLERLKSLCDAEDVDFCDLGEFGCVDEHQQPILKLNYQGTQVGQLSMHFLHDGIPTPTREAVWSPTVVPPTRTIVAQTISQASTNIGAILLALLAHPNIASKHWIIRQYDHEVQGGSVIKPLVGPRQDGPSDASVLRPKLTSHRGIALACGLAPALSEKKAGGDSYWATLAAIDECVRNLICVGVDPAVTNGGGIAILDNFCWPKCDPGSDPRNLGSLVRAAEACYDGAMAYRTPFVSGKDSLSNQFTTEDGRIIAIPPTLLITGLGMVPDVHKCRSMDAKQPGNLLVIVGATQSNMGGSHYLQLTGDPSLDQRIPQVDLQRGPATAQAVAQLIQSGLVQSAHDCSEGGLLVAAAEMAFAGNVGLDIDLDGLPSSRELDDITACFGESPSRYLLEVRPDDWDALARSLQRATIAFGQIGRFTFSDELTVRCRQHGRVVQAKLESLRQAWWGTLDW